MTNTITFSDIDLAGDVKQFISMSKDVSYASDKIYEFVFSCDDSDLIKVTKTIASPIKIIDVVKVDEDYIVKNL